MRATRRKQCSYLQHDEILFGQIKWKNKPLNVAKFSKLENLYSVGFFSSSGFRYWVTTFENTFLKVEETKVVGK